ncbi:hypothetical protein [Nitrosopumilus ureiphilus]|uniref:Peptidase n=1 Tax=Nitrosopumilus ureiphilus TaxID=1470067 RepID=A0A7D5M3T0_9ARCH|nr:hypothetical protein [Nitrosopumilus ureiphilus]QLH05992.1 hypothetical protein C5F50_02060 [Nitrosopumilus ureiphilus]
MENKDISYVFLLYLFLFSVSIIEVSALEDKAKEITIAVSTDRLSYREGDTIRISGTLSEMAENEVISIVVKNPAGNIASIEQLRPQADKTFQTEFVAGGGAWQDGRYTVTVQYGLDAAATITFDFANEPVTKIIVTADKASYSPSDIVSITVESLQHNLNSDLLDLIGDQKDDKITISSDLGTIDGYLLVETGTDTGIFVGKIMLTGSNGKTGGDGPNDGRLAVSDKIVITFSDKHGTFSTSAVVEEPQIEINVETTKPVYDSSELVQVLGSVFPYFEDEQIFVSLIDPTGMILGTSFGSLLPDGSFSDGFWSARYNDIQGSYKIKVKYKDVTETISFQIIKDTNGDVPLHDKSLTEPSLVPSGIDLVLGKHVYKKGDSVILDGTVENPTIKSEIAISIINPQDNTVFVSQLKPSDSGDFSYTVMAQGPLWEYEGAYTVIVTFGDDVSQSRFVLQEPVSIPDWIRTNAKWWSEDQISDDEFTKGMEFLIKEDIVRIKEIPEIQSNDKNIPEWVKTNADWWSQGLISDEDFAKGIEFLVEQGIIQI